jgi:RNA polymerase sigma-70 factor (ECF subfamily)
MSGMQATSSNFLTASGPRFRVKGRPRRLTKSVSSDSRLSMTVRARALSPASSEWCAIQRAIAGDCNELDQLFSACTVRLHRTAFAILRNREDAEDAVQNGLCSAYIKLRCFQGQSSFSTWLTRIVINSALMIRRKKVRRPETSLDDMLDNQPERTHHKMVHTGPNPEQICARSEAVALMKKQVCDLSRRLRLTFQLCDLEGYPAADVIQSLGLRHGSLKSRLCRARKKIANGLRRSLQRPTGESRELSLAPAQVSRTKNRSVEGEMYECYNSGDICQEVGGLVHRA